MAPFLYTDLKSLVNNLLEMVMKSEAFMNKSSIQLINELDLTDNNNLLPVKQINIGFAAEDILRKLLTSDFITTLHVKNFRLGAQKFIIKILSKLFQRSPLGSAVVRHSFIFNPSVMVGLPKKSAQNQLKILLKQLIALNILTPQCCDKISLHHF